jgi:hypothetical protein
MGNYVDVTRAILQALAEVHPRGIHADVLACLVQCEQLALRKELRLLRATGAVNGGADTTEVSITEPAIAMLRRRASTPRY